ncbi:pleckstrin-2 isoform X2 [Phyllostomus hastatus]|uniref:pleckstrin-2 isoform X2 n=1 Tax=Phyllostomus hastatus TaxID=9423 RepID=UPI001E68547F|nr:pleckstrin-2 isoform X2 [Phyllostomus hastatus]
MEDGVLKEGFLVKRGHIVHNWKVRWFVLRQNTLLYYKLEGGRKVTPPKGQILLDGCTITCPCLEYENRPFLIKLKTRTSTEYFLEACSREDRDAWAFEITGAIHAGQPGKVQQLHMQRNSFKLPPHLSLHRIVDKMHDSNSGIRPSPNMEQGSTYKKTFIGSSLVDWLISNSFAANRLEAVTLASVLMEENFLRPVGARSTGAIRSGDLAEQFLDDSTALYTFAESYKEKTGPKEEMNLSTMELSGTVIKQGYLAKQNVEVVLPVYVCTYLHAAVGSQEEELEGAALCSEEGAGFPALLRPFQRREPASGRVFSSWFTRVCSGG